ncbi:hypothetical protein MUA04_00115, partial [Enterobacteriaceae bacterium H11S18]|uniref:hypothetical protein n=1 Tax=Dryocola clanedunensis TaxID=2925396 RepID=UPI0022F0DBF5
QQTSEASALNQQLKSFQDAAKSAEAKNATLTAQLATLQKQQGASSSELKSQLLKSQEEAKLAASARTELQAKLDKLTKQQTTEA